jgi:hypothetical protein
VACLLGKNGALLETLETASGHHLSVGSPSVCSQGMPCQVSWYGMLGLGRGGQRQLRFLTAMDSNFTACPHQPSMLHCSLLVKLQLFSVSLIELSGSRTCHRQLLQVVIYKTSRTTLSASQTMHPVLLA